MPENANQTELKRRNALRLSNEESNQLTRECIEAALVMLMKDHDFESISIMDIIRRAGVSRSAYYRNYSSKQDILTNIYDRVATAIVDALSVELATQNMVSSYRVLFDKVQEISPLFEIIQMAGMMDQFQMSVNAKYLQVIDVNSAVEYYRVLSWIGSIFNIILGWMQRENRETPEQMALICSQFLSEDEWRIGTGIKWNSTAGNTKEGDA
ncbi:MAG: TetR/AcrR family transcriptional regulator [Oscillospiraceae bacterium]|nr:TetR/AcrR family transcriptional regulator [Clostridia bacterium]MBQ9167386.1 TetR/AcrR family transcriptional regulator [Oscillospiraceae bacterium]